MVFFANHHGTELVFAPERLFLNSFDSFGDCVFSYYVLRKTRVVIYQALTA
jgi:hypothetical protein